MSAELVALVQQIAKEKDLPLEAVLGAMCDGLRIAYEKQFMRDIPPRQRKRMHPRIVAVLDLDTRLLKLALEKTVVERPANTHLEISLEDAQRINPDAQLGSRVRVELPLTEFSRSAMQSARQKMQERIREIEQRRVYELYKDRDGTVVVGQVLRKDSHENIYLALDRAEALLPRREQVPAENLQKGERVSVFIYEVRKPTGSTEPNILVSRTHKELLRKLLEITVPEIRDGSVEIKGLVRDPGYRSKVAVAAKDPTIDPVGACIGQQGKRIDSIMKELRGERVDIILWSPDEADFLARALSPAKVETIIMNIDERTATVVVNEDQLSFAIGRQGRNVSLAARLTGWRIDIRTADRLGREVPTDRLSEPPSPRVSLHQETSTASEELSEEGTVTTPTPTIAADREGGQSYHPNEPTVSETQGA